MSDKSPGSNLVHSKPVYKGKKQPGKAALMDVLLDLPLAFKMRYSRLPISTAYGAVHQVLHSRGFGGIRQRLALANFAVVSRLPEILHREDAL